ncbi:RsmD family RNA methyltransferase [Alkalitalea saponilacus]|uniref:16S rRNA (Guanine(966)-N(2))-methyltransferase RsmD n=1 Tax=Alkalitalea saponilacus TaxID=889453 RepID=A0A1T5H9G5_9BACT|nr:RsmD family RNA methyltransferase [Alkalitalea saponilacus]ASB50822.1 16S rRNA (guanine(966)-N(2))-methyltransferase RsmD [Alkalitalea saponilacus]SKC17284.1 16S rRNA (guanine(966)-N(2))-methyltransferase RsmD [Alkalitalea saponilacus]
MRIVSGYLKGRRFSPPKNFRARPTTDTARESLFNILANIIDFESVDILDLFSGTGAISFEFASRGANSVTLVEKNYHHYSFIRKCIDELELNEVIKPVKTDVFTYLDHVSDQQYDIIFADPPFDLKEFEKIVPAVLDRNLLKTDGIFILEHGPDKNFSDFANFNQQRKYGKVCFSFFGNKPEE